MNHRPFPSLSGKWVLRLMPLIYLLMLAFLCLGLKDFEHERERTDRERPSRPPLYRLVRVTPPTTPAEEDETPTPMPKLPPAEYPQNYPPPEKLPRQGMLPKIERRTPLELQDEGNIMSHPMPQRNPAPSSVFLPYDYQHRIPRRQ